MRLLGLMAAAVLLVGCGGNSVEDQAKDACRKFVVDKLKSPTSAKFQDFDVQKADPYYVVSGSVDAENSFGATLRSSFSCSVEPKGDGWRLLGIQGLN